MIGDVFGVMDSRSKKKYQEDISGLMANDEHLLGLIKNQTSLVEKTLDILQMNENEIQRRGEQFTNLTQRIDKTMDEYAAASFFSGTVIHLFQEMADFNDRINVLLETIFDSRKHHINHNLFPPKQLAAEIKTISEHVRNKYVVPEGGNVYNLMSIVPHILEQQILFHVSIPLFQVDELKIFHIVPVPYTSGNKTWSIYTKNKFLIVSNDRTRYQFMSGYDLQQCAQYGQDVVCWGPYHWNTARVQSCEWSIFNEISNENCTVNPNQMSSNWYNVGINQWLFYSKTGSCLTFVCHDGVFRETIVGSGLLRFNQNCTVRNFDIEINGKKTFHGRQIDVMIPKVGKYYDHSIKWEHSMTQSNWAPSNINELRGAIEEIRTKSSLPFHLNYHDIHHYAILYVLISAFVAFCLFTLFKYKKMKSRLNLPTRAVSMPSIPELQDNDHEINRPNE